MTMRKTVGVAVPALIVAGTLLMSGLALGAKYKKGADVQVQATQTTLTKVQAKPKGEGPTRPAIMAEQFREQAAAKVERLTDAAIATMKRLISVTSDNDPEKPDFFFRLAEHYREKKTQFMFRARELDEKIYQAQSESEKGRYQGTQKSYERQEHQWMLESIKMYLHIAQTPAYSKFKRMDEVLFNVADMLNQAKRQDKARIFFSQLIRNYPDSKYIPDAYLSFAEFYFNDGKVEEALKLYQRVGKYPNSPVYGYAVYKEGWCWLNLKDPRQALEKFVTVIKNAGTWAGGKKSKIILVKEAKKDAVRAYSHVGTPDKAWSFFQRIGGNYAMKMLEMLANLYYDQGKFTQSVQTYHKLIALNPKSPELCAWQYSIVKSTLSAGDKRSQVKEAQRLASVYQETKGRGDMKKTAISECRNNASGVLRELATTWHREAQKTQNQDTYALAQYLYKEYLDNFPSEKDAYLMTYYYAELLYKLERWEPAAEVYTKVVKMNPRGKYLTDAAYAAVISWKNALNVEEEIKDTSKKVSSTPKKGKKGKKGEAKEDENQYKPIAIPEKQKKMLAAFDTYIKYVPKAPELVQIKYRKARIYYETNHFKEAAAMFGDIATKHPEHELSLYAANLLLDSLNILKRFEELNQWVSRFKKEPKLAQGEFLATLNTLDAASKRKHAEELQKTGSYKECGDKYAAIANEYQDDPRWPELLYNAAICFEAAKLIGMAISIRNTLIKVKPKDPRAQKAMYMVGANYHALAWYSRAAEYYERFAMGYPGETEAPEALQNAIVFRMGRGEHDKAVEDAKFFQNKFGTRPKYIGRSAAVNFSLGAIYEQNKEKEAVIKHYTSYLSKWGKHGGADRQIQAHVKIGEVLWEQSCPGKSVNGACIKVQRVEAKKKIAKKTGKKKRKKGAAEVRTQCGPETKMKVTVVKRNPAKAKAAQKHFKDALVLFRKAPKVKAENKDEMDRRNFDMRYSAAAAQFYLAEEAFEEFLQVKFPQNLDFSDRDKKKKEKSQKEFGKYLDEKGKKLKKTSDVYEDVIKTKVAHWAIAASARIGQLYQNFSDALYTAPIPKPPIPKTLTKKEDQEDFVAAFGDSYCDALEDKAKPLDDKAQQGLKICLDKSTELSWYNEWSKLCEAELNQIDPNTYPLTAEIRAEPGYVTYRTDRAAVVDTIK
jgi:tetratricopeptide (TPR) repeat protein